jgi:hypothetical protein
MPRSNLNYYLYTYTKAALHRSRWLLPASLVTPVRSLDQEFCIGITTYIERYDRYFKPLYRAISRCFPEVRLSVAVNGHGNSDDQQRYLARFQEEICSTAPSHHSFVLHDRPVGLTMMWNEILGLSLPLPVLILNDDLRIYAWMRRWAEAFNWKSNHLTLLNSTWSHFVISKQAIDLLGAFDPGFQGIGFEDMDYTARAGLAGFSIANVLCPYITHQNHQPKSTSYDSDSGRVWGKYTSANQAYFFSKWEACPAEEGVFIKQIPAHVKPSHPLTPIPLPRIARVATGRATTIFPDRPSAPQWA